MNWKGVMPAITTCFTEDLKVDHGFMADTAIGYWTTAAPASLPSGRWARARRWPSTRRLRFCAPA